MSRGDETDGREDYNNLARREQARYNRKAVEAAIKRDKRISPQEARMIHAVLKGRQKEDE